MTQEQEPIVITDRADKLGMETLYHRATVVDTGTAVYDAGTIGLPSSMGPVDISVIAEFAIPVTTPEAPDSGSALGHAIVLREVSRRTGNERLYIQGLEVGKDGSAAPVKPRGSVDPLNPLHRVKVAKSIILGRSAELDDTEGRLDGVDYVSAERIWGEGSRFGIHASREHLMLHVSKDGQLVITDDSLNGTRLLTAERNTNRVVIHKLAGAVLQGVPLEPTVRGKQQRAG